MMRRASPGFSLLEVMIAVAILAVSLMAIFSLQSTSLMSSARAQKISIATQLAREKMARTLVDLDAGMVKGEFPDEKEESGRFEEEKFPDYFWKLSVKKVEIPVPPAGEGLSTGDGSPAKEGSSDVMGKIFEMVSKQLSESSREVKLTVGWTEYDSEEEETGIVLTTHIVKM